MEEKSDAASSSSSHLTSKASEGRSLPLKARYGINAWKRWVLSPPDQSDDTKAKDTAKAGKLNTIISQLPCSLVTLPESRCVPQFKKQREELIVLLENIF